MKTATAQSDLSPELLAVHVVEPGVRPGARAICCKIGANVQFSTASLESYFFATWEPVAWDALLVAAAVEFADRTKHRPPLRGGDSSNCASPSIIHAAGFRRRSKHRYVTP
jgi:hypothetical protein